MRVGAEPTGRRAQRPAELSQRRRRLARFIAQIEGDGEEASFWAEHCGWVAGTGHCRIGGAAVCDGQCVFAAMREAEAEHIRRSRQQRRRPASDLE